MTHRCRRNPFGLESEGSAADDSVSKVQVGVNNHTPTKNSSVQF